MQSLRSYLSAHTGDVVTALLTGVFISLVCIFTGPETIDGMDGPEFAVAGSRLEVPHSPGYPLLMWLLRLSGGSDYDQLRVFTCCLAGLAASAVFLALRTFGAGTAASAITALLLMSSGAVLTQLNTLEVHSLSLFLAAAAIAARKTRLGPYVMGMAVFGGHPLSIFLLPMTVSGNWKRTWPLFFLPASMWIYVPLRAKAELVMHYGAPSDISAFLRYLSMYGGRISPATLSGLSGMMSAMGLVTSLTLLLTAVMGKPGKRLIFTMAGVIAVFLFYGIPDVQAYSWLLLLPVTAAAVKGVQFLFDRGKPVIPILLAVLTAASAATGILKARDTRENAIQTITSDLLRGIPPDRVLITSDANTYYCAYLLEAEDRRPDLLAMDRFGLVHVFSLLQGPMPVIPPELAGRPVHATAAWGELPPSGVLFSMEGPRLEWDDYEVFTRNFHPAEDITGDLLAELWTLRAIQEPDTEDSRSALLKAETYARSEGALSAVHQIMESSGIGN